MSRCATLLAALALSLLGACSTLPGPAQRAPSQAFVDVAGTALAQRAAALTPDDRRHLSGLRLLPDAAEALALRLALARRAQASIDAQYYLVADDASGHAFLRALRDAAARGVRVRLLVDDLHVATQEPLLAALARHEGVEVRLFNPLPARGGSPTSRLLRSLHEFERVNRRMHNKLFVADNAWAVSGGRNIGDDYFMRGDTANFVDMDLLSSGPVVRELSDLFDRFWNSEASYPIAQLVTAEGTPAQQREQFDGRTAPGAAGEQPGAEADDERFDERVCALQFAAVSLYADSPEKVLARAAVLPTAMDSTLALFRSAREEVLIASPYFIPGERGLALMREAVDQGVRIGVVTNSLAATDEPLAHGGYMRYRLAMLRLGVALSEMRPTPAGAAAHIGAFHSSLSRLHAKLGVVDRRWLLVGSMNMDSRSSRTNTEFGLAIDSPALAAQVAQLLQRGWAPRHFYRLQLADGGARVRWVEAAGGSAAATHETEPEVPWFDRMRVDLLSLFVAEGLL